MKSILIIPSWYDTPNNKIRGSFFKEQALALREMGYKVTVLYSEVYSWKNIHEFIRVRKVRQYEENGVNVIRNAVLRKPKSGLVGIAKTYIKSITKLYDDHINNKIHIDLIHAHSAIWGGCAAEKICRVHDMKYIVTEHYSGVMRNSTPIEMKRSIRDVYKNSKTNVAVSQALANAMEQHFDAKNTTIIPNMVDVSKFDVGCDESYDSQFTFFALSNLFEGKAVDVLVRAFSEVVAINPKSKLLIGGDGPEREKIIKLISELKLEKNIELLGRLDRYKVNENMQKCNAFIHTSRFETFGIVLIEALACGKPVISTKSGGPNQFINDENGILIDVDDVKGISSAMLLLVENINTYNSSDIRKYCIQNFSEDVVMAKVTHLYEKMI